MPQMQADSQHFLQDSGVVWTEPSTGREFMEAGGHQPNYCRVLSVQRGADGFIPIPQLLHGTKSSKRMDFQSVALKIDPQPDYKFIIK